MRGTKAILVALVLMAIVGTASSASAQVKFLGAGSSAMFNGMAVAAFSDVCSARTGSDCHHWSISGKTPGGNNFAQGVDTRSASIKPEGGTLWVVWDNNTTPKSVWAYLSVDSVVGNRLFHAVPRATLQVDPSATSTAGTNQVPSTILLNRQTNTTQADDASLPSAILSLVQTAFTAGMTDIRPEDAKYATNRALAAYTAANLNGLGYGVASANCPGATSMIGCPIQSSFGSGTATPVQFSLATIKDPISGLKSGPSVTIPVGAAPIVFIYNHTGPGLSAGISDLTFTTAGNLFNGTLGLAKDIGGTGNNPLTVMLREPMSGTMNTTEFTTFRVALAPKYAAPKNSQEKGIDLTKPNTNPLNLASADGGVRVRGIGTGQVMNGVSGVGGILNTADSVAYAFFSFGNVSKIAGAGGVGRYVTLNGVDPIQGAYSAGVLPLCSAPCPATPGTTFPHLRDGSYRAWSILRLVTDKTGANFTNAQALVTALQNELNATVPDFVSYAATTDGDPGMPYYRSHFKVAGVAGTPNNGIGNANLEKGGDVGGCPFRKTDDEVCFRLNGVKSATSKPAFCTYALHTTTACSLAPGH